MLDRDDHSRHIERLADRLLRARAGLRQIVRDPAARPAERRQAAVLVRRIARLVGERRGA